MTIKAEFIMIVQKNQAEKLVLTDTKNNTKKQQYIKHCIRRAYIVSICQPKATFNYLIAAQFKK